MSYDDKVKRRLIETYNELPEALQLEILDAIKYNGIMQAAEEIKKTGTVYFGDLYAAAIDRQKTFFAFEGMKTGLKYFDESTMGLRAGETIVIAGPSNLGKTMVGLNIVTHTILNSGVKCLIVSMEMPAIDIVSRMFNMTSHHEQLMENVIVQTELDVNTKHIAAMIERHQPDLVMLDHIQFLGVQEKASTEHEKINIAVKKIQRLAVDYRLPIIFISHVSKARSGKNSSATAADLKGSSSIEQDSDIVFMLNRNDDQRQNGNLSVNLVKHRKKPSTLYYKPCILQFDGVKLAQTGEYSYESSTVSKNPYDMFKW